MLKRSFYTLAALSIFLIASKESQARGEIQDARIGTELAQKIRQKRDHKKNNTLKISELSGRWNSFTQSVGGVDRDNSFGNSTIGMDQSYIHRDGKIEQILGYYSIYQGGLNSIDVREIKSNEVELNLTIIDPIAGLIRTETNYKTLGIIITADLLVIRSPSNKKIKKAKGFVSNITDQEGNSLPVHNLLSVTMIKQD